MIDTIKIWFDLSKPLEADVIVKIADKHSLGLRSGSKCIGRDNNILIFPYGFGLNSARVSAQVSLPRLVKETNVQPLSLEETRASFQKFTCDLSKILRLDAPPSLDDCHVHRADFVYDWVVDSPEAYLSVLERFAVVRGNHSIMVWKNGLDKGTTVKVGSKQQMMMAYNKEAEVGFRGKFNLMHEDDVDHAKGRLRAELAVKSKGWIPVFEKTSPTLAELDAFLLKNGRRLLSEKWDTFTDGWGDSSMESATVRLAVANGKQRGRQLAETLSLVRSMGVNKYRQVCNPDPSTWYRFRQALRKSGVPLTDSGGLERLTIPWFDVDCIDISGLIVNSSVVGGQRNG